MTQPTHKHHSWQRRADGGIKGRMIFAFFTCIALVFGLGGWAAVAQISGAVIASGQVVVDSNSKKVQHPTGGIVAEIAVKNGDRVNAGDIVVRLDDTQTRASLGVINSQLSELIARRARHAAERDTAEKITFPDDFLQNTANREIADGEQRLFNENRSAREGRKSQLRERIAQLEEEITGLKQQANAKKTESVLVSKELERVADMYARRLTPVTRVLSMERDKVRIAGEHANLLSTIASTKGKQTEIRLQIIAIDQDARTEAQKSLRDTDASIANLKEKRVAAEDQMRRVNMRAPQDGVVHAANVHTIGGVVAPGEPLMLIVPTGDRLTMDVRVAPSDIDQIKANDEAILRFSAFNQRTTPEIPGRVKRIGADLSVDPDTKQSYYKVRIEADESALKDLKGLTLIPGMPVEAFIQTTQRTALSFLIKPVSDQVGRAFREE